jgi:hypothetical protein
MGLILHVPQDGHTSNRVETITLLRFGERTAGGIGLFHIESGCYHFR